MKKLFSLLTLFVLISLFSNNLYSQDGSLYLNGGYSWTKGMFGLEWKSGHWGIGVGYMPTKMPMSGEKVTSLSASFSLYTVKPGDVNNGLYATIATTTAGYRMEDSYGNKEISPMTIATVGYISDLDVFNLIAGVGYGFYSGGSTFTYEIALGIRLWEKW